jgi:hypothetical protein
MFRLTSLGWPGHLWGGRTFCPCSETYVTGSHCIRDDVPLGLSLGHTVYENQGSYAAMH